MPYLLGGGVLLISGICLVAYLYITGLQNQITTMAANNAILEANVTQLETAITTQEDTIESLHDDIDLQGEIIDDTIEAFNDTRVNTREIEAKLKQHNLGMLTREKPGLVGKIINNRIKEQNRCFEILSGSPLTEDEINAIKPSQINDFCPELANPNFGIIQP